MANNIAKIRIKHGLTQRELAEKVGMATHAIGYAENRCCGIELASKTAELLGENVFEVMGSDVFKILPSTDEDKRILIDLINSL